MSLTEKTNPLSKGIDAFPTGEILRIMHGEDAAVMDTVGKQIGRIAQAVDDTVDAIRSGGKVIYAGAGTSGRLGVLDAAEVMPTFGSDRFEAVIAGGRSAISRSVEGAEDDEAAGEEAASRVRASDMAFGISASGKTPFVLSFLRSARQKGAKCWLITCNEVRDYPFVNGIIKLLTGPEIVAGSTRLKAATATKLVLNMLSTAAMIRLGKVYDGLMVDVVPTNNKLVRRAESIVMEITGCPRAEASEVLRLSEMRPKVAVLMKMNGVSKKEAESLLEKSEGSLRKALGP